MVIEKLNSWLTLVANLGVLVGIVFLAVEINQSNRQAQSATNQARGNEIDQSFRELALSDSMSNIYLKISESGIDSLSPLETLRAQNWERAKQIRMSLQLDQYDYGFLDEQAFRGLMEAGVRSYPIWLELGLPEDLTLRRFAEAYNSNN